VAETSLRVLCVDANRLSRRKQIIEEQFDCDPWEDDWTPRYNIAPTQPSPSSARIRRNLSAKSR